MHRRIVRWTRTRSPQRRAPGGRLLNQFAGLPYGHNGSHQFLVDDFVNACVTGERPPSNVWDAARYPIPGLVAHESAMEGGVLIAVPDLGHPDE